MNDIVLVVLRKKPPQIAHDMACLWVAYEKHVGNLRALLA
jgi:hypothetical protein